MSLWIAHAERTISEEIPAPPDEVRDFYVDLDNIKDFTSAGGVGEAAGTQLDAKDNQKTYRVRDRIPLGPFIDADHLLGAVLGPYSTGT